MVPHEGLVTRNTHVKYENPITSSKKVIAKVKVFHKKVKLQGQGHKVKKNVVPRERPCHNKYTYEIWKLYL